jgi:hypothetical protein
VRYEQSRRRRADNRFSGRPQRSSPRKADGPRRLAIALVGAVVIIALVLLDRYF